MAIFATTAASLSPREQTFADIIEMIDDAVAGDDITSTALAGMILEMVEKNMREHRAEAQEDRPLNAVCNALEEYAANREEYEVADCGLIILQGMEECFWETWKAA